MSPARTPAGEPTSRTHPRGRVAKLSTAAPSPYYAVPNRVAPDEAHETGVPVLIADGGMSRWEESSAGKTQVSAKVPDELKAAFEEACEENGRTQTSVIKQAMREFVENHGGSAGGPLFGDEVLKAAYQTLRQRADPDTNRISPEAAESAVAERTRIKSKAVRRRVLDPLERRGAIIYDWGRIYVAPVDVVSTDGRRAEA